MKLLLLIAVLASCGDNELPDFKEDDQDPYFHWDGQRDVGAYAIGNQRPRAIDLILHRIDALDDRALILYGHGDTSPVTIESVFAHAHDAGVETLTFVDLVRGGTPRPGLVVSFDDNDIDAWYSWRDIFARYNAHATFFVTKYHEFSDEDRRKLHVLYAEGHDIEAHGVHHIGVPEYTVDHTAEQYVRDEVMPSLDILKQDGFAPVAFAFPGGAENDKIVRILEPLVPITRGITQLPE